MVPPALHSSQSGGYLQGVYQFMPRWRVAIATTAERWQHPLRTNDAYLPVYDYSPTANTLMA